MYKKFLWALYAGLMLCNLKTTSQAGRYTEAFEYEVQNNSCRKLTCNITNNPTYTYRHYTKGVPVQTGYSVGPLGTTKHYGYRSEPATESYKTDHYKCSRCGHDKGSTCGWLFYPSVPKITIKQNGNTRLMTIYGVRYPDFPDLPMCGNPSFEYKGKLADIWEKAGLKISKKGEGGYDWKSSLEKLWEAARQLDEDESGEIMNDNMELDDNKTNIKYVVETPPSSSCLIQ